MSPKSEHNQGTCPVCNSPVASGMKFCETCGAKIEPLPVCAQCGAPLPPNVKFCESCGKPVAAPVAPPVSAAPSTSAPVMVFPEVKPPAPETSAPAPADVKKPAPEPEPKAAAKEKAPDKKAPESLKETVTRAPGKAVPASSTQTLMIAGIVGLVIVVALAYFVLLPMLSGSGTPGSSATLFGATPVPSAASTAAPAQSSASASYVLEPTQVPPTNLLVTYQAERDPITGLVTVTFTGGAGQYGVSDVSIRLTRSDGQVLTQTFKPQQTGSFITLKGTLMTDHIEVTANYYNGEKYRIIDKLFEYKKKF